MSGARNAPPLILTPPAPDGSVDAATLVAARIAGVETIYKVGGAQAVAALAYGTATVPKVDKIFGPGNQWVTAAKMLVQNDTDALVAIDMPAGPSEVLVVADHTAVPAFVAADLLSQAEHGVDSQVVLVAVDLDDATVTVPTRPVDLPAGVSVAWPVRYPLADGLVLRSATAQVLTRIDAGRDLVVLVATDREEASLVDVVGISGMYAVLFAFAAWLFTRVRASGA